MSAIDITSRTRQPAGIRTGGQFATEPRTESSVSLTQQQRALDDLVGPGLRPARALGVPRQDALRGMPKPAANAGAWASSPVARFRAGEQTVAELVENRGWEAVRPVEQHDARFPASAAATNGEVVVQSFVDSDHGTTCLVALPARTLPGQDPWSRAEYIGTAGKRVELTAVEQSTGIVALRTYEESEARASRGRLAPADLAVEVDSLLG